MGTPANAAPAKRFAPIPVIGFLVIIGIWNLSNTLSRPSMANVRNVDIVRLTGCGFSFGVAFGIGAMALIRPFARKS